jgi:hypothetical protein
MAGVGIGGVPLEDPHARLPLISDYRRHRFDGHVENCFMYTGTHDHNTARGWYEAPATFVARSTPPAGSAVSQTRRRGGG